MAPQVQTLDQIIASLNPAYAPSENLYNQQIQTVPTQANAAIAGLDTAKNNAFNDINTGANSKGLAFSGIPISEQARYTGEKYLPAVAGIQSDTQNKTFTLQQALASLEQDKQKTALGTQQGQQSALDAYNQEIAKEQFTAQQNALDRQSQQTIAGIGAGGGNNPAAGYKVSKFSSGNYNFQGPNGQTNMYQYAAALNGGDPQGTYDTIKQLLAAGSATDKGAAAGIAKLEKQGASQAQIIARLKSSNAYIFN